MRIGVSGQRKRAMRDQIPQDHVLQVNVIAKTGHPASASDHPTQCRHVQSKSLGVTVDQLPLVISTRAKAMTEGRGSPQEPQC
jgi:hypothetical protein